MVSDRFKGKELWKTINICFFFGAYTSMFIIPLFFPDLIVTLFIVLAFLAISYIALQQAIFRKMELKNAGRRVLSGWMDQEMDLGEEYEIPIKKITPFNRLSEEDKKAVDAFMKSETERLKKDGIQGLNLLERKIMETERKLEERKEIEYNKKEIKEIEFDEEYDEKELDEEYNEKERDEEERDEEERDEEERDEEERDEEYNEKEYIGEDE